VSPKKSPEFPSHFRCRGCGRRWTEWYETRQFNSFQERKLDECERCDELIPAVTYIERGLYAGRVALHDGRLLDSSRAKAILNLNGHELTKLNTVIPEELRAVQLKPQRYHMSYGLAWTPSQLKAIKSWIDLNPDWLKRPSLVKTEPRRRRERTCYVCQKRFRPERDTWYCSRKCRDRAAKHRFCACGCGELVNRLFRRGKPRYLMGHRPRKDGQPGKARLQK
jgi:hypothetical protein